MHKALKKSEKQKIEQEKVKISVTKVIKDNYAWIIAGLTFFGVIVSNVLKFIEFINKIEMAGSQKNQLTFTEKNREENKIYKLEYDEEFEIYKFMEI